MPTPHYQRVKAFMEKAGQDAPATVTIPNEKTRRLRASLILEEALETVQALGFEVVANGTRIGDHDFELQTRGAPDLEGVVDGCADISVVTIGTLVAFGVEDEPVLEEVDRANLRKFGPGSYVRKDGKWMKPPDWTPPDIRQFCPR
ncbi:MAG: hypothetical protein OXU68_13035 [Bacteroidota bacterium]|nr:hypothetical protein [Bacteroidota bacterium]